MGFLFCISDIDGEMGLWGGKKNILVWFMENKKTSIISPIKALFGS